MLRQIKQDHTWLYLGLHIERIWWVKVLRWTIPKVKCGQIQGDGGSIFYKL